MKLIFFLHHQKARQETQRLPVLAPASRQLPASQLPRAAQGCPGATDAGTSRCLILALMPSRLLTARYTWFLAWEIPICPPVSSGPVSSPNGTNRKSNIMVYHAADLLFYRSHNVFYTGFYAK